MKAVLFLTHREQFVIISIVVMTFHMMLPAVSAKLMTAYITLQLSSLATDITGAFT